ncbi:MAG TPA: membrane protein insertion efficiency factor YidD [Methylomirabilota bacterium]|nr:membrane protein insertion efficiency factor YidD [Methylomirabilota bacterium]
MTLATRAALVAVGAYQLLGSPFLGRHCRFAPTCSEYARGALIDHGARRGAWLALRRLLRCHPFHPGGYDPPPPARPRPA